jgi:hypothetical protein
MSALSKKKVNFHIGQRVRIRRGRRPVVYEGHEGTVLRTDNDNPHYAHLPNDHLIQLDPWDGWAQDSVALQLWYCPEELEPL